MSNYDFEVEFRTGKKSGKSDAHSRCENPQAEKQTLNREHWIKGFEHKELASIQKADPDIGHLMKALRSGERPKSHSMVTFSPDARHYRILWDDLRIESGVLVKTFRREKLFENYTQIIVPKTLRKKWFNRTIMR